MTTKPAILMVDDDPDECRNMSDILIDQGYCVDTAHDGQSALRLMQMQVYDLALLDLKMPGMDGVTLSKEVTRLHPATAALLITGYPEDVLPVEAKAAGIRHVFCKPVDVARLLERIEDTLAG